MFHTHVARAYVATDNVRPHAGTGTNADIHAKGLFSIYSFDKFVHTQLRLLAITFGLFCFCCVQLSSINPSK